LVGGVTGGNAKGSEVLVTLKTLVGKKIKLIRHCRGKRKKSRDRKRVLEGVGGCSERGAEYGGYGEGTVKVGGGGHNRENTRAEKTLKYTLGPKNAGLWGMVHIVGYEHQKEFKWGKKDLQTEGRRH